MRLFATSIFIHDNFLELHIITAIFALPEILTMRNLIALFLILLTSGCRTYSYFNSPNNLLNEDCQVFLMNGTKIDGKLTVQFETGHFSDNYLKIMTNPNTEKKILITDIQCYKFRNEYYVPKQIDLEEYTIPIRYKLYTPNVNNILFLRRLTSENAKLQLFELFQSKDNTSDGFDQHNYYISFNNENRLVTWSIRGTKFFPNFDQKMSSIVSDCPALSKKIEEREMGYVVKQVSIDAKKNEVIKRIIDEYNQCDLNTSQ